MKLRIISIINMKNNKILKSRVVIGYFMPSDSELKIIKDLKKIW